MRLLRTGNVLIGAVLISHILPSLASGAGSDRAQESVPQAVAGSLDSTFGGGGSVTTDFFGKPDQAQDVLVQPDGKIVVAGQSLESINGLDDFALARYNPDGSLDSSFGAGGKVTTEFLNGVASPRTVALQPDGKIVAAGGAFVGDNLNVVMARYNSDGSLDAGFGPTNNGKLTLDFHADSQIASAAIQSDGKIVVAGYRYGANFTDSQFIVARLLSTGALDPSFGGGGLTTGVSVGEVNLAQCLAIQPDGKIVVAGSSGQSATTRFTVVRYNTNGSLDTTFGSGGSVTTVFFGLSDFIDKVLVMPDGRLVVAGTVTGTQKNLNFGLVRYHPDGTLDASFGSGGKVTTSFPAGDAQPLGAALQSDGKVVVVGWTNPGDALNARIAIARYNLDGSLDQNFATGGQANTDLFGVYSRADAVAIQPDGNIVVAGGARKTLDSITEDFAVLRYLAETAGFTLGLSQSTLNGDRGTTVKVEISINRVNGFNGNVTVTPPDSPPGLKVKPPDPIATLDSGVSFKLKIKAGAPVGPQQLTFVGKTDSGQVSTATLILNVQ